MEHHPHRKFRPLVPGGYLFHVYVRGGSIEILDVGLFLDSTVDNTVADRGRTHIWSTERVRRRLRFRCGANPFIVDCSERGGAVVARKAHNLEVAGASPAPATTNL